MNYLQNKLKAMMSAGFWRLKTGTLGEITYDDTDWGLDDNLITLYSSTFVKAKDYTVSWSMYLENGGASHTDYINAKLYGYNESNVWELLEEWNTTRPPSSTLTRTGTFTVTDIIVTRFKWVISHTDREYYAHGFLKATSWYQKGS